MSAQRNVLEATDFCCDSLPDAMPFPFSLLSKLGDSDGMYLSLSPFIFFLLRGWDKGEGDWKNWCSVFCFFGAGLWILSVLSLLSPENPAPTLPRAVNKPSSSLATLHSGDVGFRVCISILCCLPCSHQDISAVYVHVPGALQGQRPLGSSIWVGRRRRTEKQT